MGKSIPITLVHIRKFKPLSITFPPPGTYTGKIVMILPNSDDTILGRLGDSGHGAVTVEFTTEKFVTAQTLHNFIAAQVSNLQMLCDQVATPIRPDVLDHLRAGRTKTDKGRAYKLAGLGDPLESLHDEMPAGSWSETDE